MANLLTNLLLDRNNIDSQSNPYYTSQMRMCLKRLKNGRIMERVGSQLLNRAPALADPLSFAIGSSSGGSSGSSGTGASGKRSRAATVSGLETTAGGNLV